MWLVVPFSPLRSTRGRLGLLARTSSSLSYSFAFPSALEAHEQSGLPVAARVQCRSRTGGCSHSHDARATRSGWWILRPVALASG